MLKLEGHRGHGGSRFSCGRVRAGRPPARPGNRPYTCKSPGQIIVVGANKVYTGYGGVFPAMPYCPNCLTEYVQGTTTCEDCGAALAPGSPPQAPPPTQNAGFGDSKLVTVRVFSGPTALLDADVARNILQSQGIPSFVPGEISAELLPVLDVSLLVREEDAEQASRILRDYLESEVAGPGD